MPSHSICPCSGPSRFWTKVGLASSQFISARPIASKQPDSRRMRSTLPLHAAPSVRSSKAGASARQLPFSYFSHTRALPWRGRSSPSTGTFQFDVGMFQLDRNVVPSQSILPDARALVLISDIEAGRVTTSCNVSKVTPLSSPWRLHPSLIRMSREDCSPFHSKEFNEINAVSTAEFHLPLPFHVTRSSVEKSSVDTAENAPSPSRSIPDSVQPNCRSACSIWT